MALHKAPPSLHRNPSPSPPVQPSPLGRVRLRLRRSVRSAGRALWGAWRLWDHHDCFDLSAAFAYHTLQSFFPLFLIILSVAGWLLGRNDGITGQFMAWASQFLPVSALSLVQTTLDQLYRQRGGAGILGISVLLVTASNAYLSLQRGTDRLWSFRPFIPASAQPADEGLSHQGAARLLPRPVRRFLLNRLKAFSFVLVVGLLFALDQVTINLRLVGGQAMRSLASDALGAWGTLLLPVSSFGPSLLSLLIASAMAFGLQRLLPSRRVPWQALLPGSLLIGSVYTLLNLAVARSVVSLGARFQAYGIVGGVLVLTLWIWMLALLFYFGVAVSVVQSDPGPGGDPHPWRHRLNPSFRSR